MDKQNINREFKKAIKGIEDFQNGKETNRIKVLKDVNKFKKLLAQFVDDSFMKRLKDAKGQELKIGDTVSFKDYKNDDRLGLIIYYNRVTDEITIKYGLTILDTEVRYCEDVIRLNKV